MGMNSKGRIEMALRERLEMAGCHPVRAGGRGADEAWFTPHLNREFIFPNGLATVEDANAVLHAAGMEQTFKPSRSQP
jgi:hypothetical protein